MHGFFQKLDECIPYKTSSLHMKKLNCEQRVIVNDILCKKNKYSRIHLRLQNFAKKWNLWITSHVTKLHQNIQSFEQFHKILNIYISLIE
jgi:hypothetical protein